MDISEDCPPPGTEGYEEVANNQQNCSAGGSGISAEKKRKLGSFLQNDSSKLDNGKFHAALDYVEQDGNEASAEKKRKLGSFLQSHSFKLDNGKFHAALDYVEQDGKSAYLCFPCAVTCYTEISLQGHLNGKAHANKLSPTHTYSPVIITNHPFLNINKPKKSGPAGIGALPVKNIPPPVVASAPECKQEEEHGMLWHYLRDYKQSPVIGLEYIIELTSDYGPVECFCALCEMRGDVCSIVNHIVGHKHKFKYMKTHYPSAFRALLVYLKENDKYRRGTSQVIHNITNCIEQAYGRLPPTIVKNEDFIGNRIKYIKAASLAHHSSERDGETFEQLVDGEYILLLSNKTEGPVSQNQPNAASESLINMKPSSPPKTVQRQRTVNVKDTIKISIKSTSKSFEKAQEEVKDLRENINALKANKTVRRTSPSKYVGGLYSGGQSADRNNPSPPNDSHNSDERGFGKRSIKTFHSREAPFHPENNRERNYGERSGSREDRMERGRSRSPLRRSPHRSRSPRNHQRPEDNYDLLHRPPVEELKRLFPDADGFKLAHKLDLFQKRIQECTALHNKTLKYHEKNPEKHPLYQEEWKKYWNKRYKELKAANADVTQFDFKPEWIVFWGKRMKELHLQQIETLKLEQCRRLNLSVDELACYKFMDKPTAERSSPKEDIDKPRNGSPLSMEGRRQIISNDGIVGDGRYIRSFRDARDNRDTNFRDFRDNKGRDARDVRDSKGRDVRDGRDSKGRDARDSRDSKGRDSRDGMDARNFRDNKGRDARDVRDSKGRDVRDGRDSKGRDARDGRDSKGRDSRDARDNRDGRDIKDGRDGGDNKRNYQSNRTGEKESRPPMNKERRFESPPKISKAGDDDSDCSPSDDDNDSVNSVIVSSRKGDSVSRDSKSASVRGRDVTSTERERKFGRSSKPVRKEISELKSDKMDINVISVLRLLTALENYLGSLGPKIIDLLAVALRMEKDKPNSSDGILLDDTYNVLFEMVKEKLKGQLLAGLVEGNAVQATKTAVQYIASLLHKVTKLAATRKLIEEHEKIKTKHMPVKVEGIGKVEKAAIAKQIAAALIAQGKTSVTTEELESLVNAVVGMANAAQTTQKPADTLGLLTKLTNPAIEKIPALSILKVKDFSKEAESSGTNALQMLQSAYTQKGGQASQVSPKLATDEPTGMEGLSDSDMKTLLQNFKDLSSDEQHGLIAYLKKLEFKEPKRVEKLRKFVNLDPERNDKLEEREMSPFSSRECGNNPEGAKSVNNKPAPRPADKVEAKPKDSDDEDDYTFEEVLKSASEKVKEKQMQDELEVINKTLKEKSDAEAAAQHTQSIISNLMVSFKQGGNSAPDTVQDSNAQNIAKVLSLISSMAGQDAQAPVPAKAPLVSVPTQQPPPPAPLPEAVQMPNQNMEMDEISNQNMPVDEISNFNMQGQSVMNQDHYDKNNYPNSFQHLQSMHNPDAEFQNMLPRGNQNDFPDDFGGQHQYNEMVYAQNQAFANDNFRPFAAGMNRGNPHPVNMRAAYGYNAAVGDNYQDMYDGDRAGNNAPNRMLPQNQYTDQLLMEGDYYNSDYYDDIPQSNFRGNNRNMNHGMMDGRGKLRGRGNMDWRGRFMRN